MGRWWVVPSLVAAALVSPGCTVDRDPQAITSLADLVADVRGLADAVEDRLDVVREREAAVLAAPCRLPDRLSGIGPGAGFPGVADRLPVDWLPSTGTLRIAVLFIDFPSTPADDESTEQAFDAGFPGAEAYLEDMSAGALDVVFLPHHRRVRLDDYLRLTSRQLVEAAVQHVDPQFDFSLVDGVAVVIPDGISWDGPHALMLDEPLATVDGWEVWRPVVLWSRRLLGGAMVAHEVLHQMGLPDLYDAWAPVLESDDPTHESWRHVGIFGLMGGSSPFRINELLGWWRWRLAWLGDHHVHCFANGSGTVDLTPIAVPGGPKLAVVPLDDTRVVVVESRRVQNYDLDLTGGGVLAYVVDGSIASGMGPVVVLGVEEGPPDERHLLQEGESVAIDGVAVTVLESRIGGDRISVDVG